MQENALKDIFAKKVLKLKINMKIHDLKVIDEELVLEIKVNLIYAIKAIFETKEQLNQVG